MKVPPPKSICIPIRTPELLVDESCAFAGPRLEHRVAGRIEAEAVSGDHKERCFEIVFEIPEGETVSVLRIQEACRNQFLDEIRLTESKLAGLYRELRLSGPLAVGLSLLLFVGSEIFFAMDSAPVAGTLARGMIIFAWVALWHPLEIVLYSQFEIRHRLGRLRRLAQARVDFHEISGTKVAEA